MTNYMQDTLVGGDTDRYRSSTWYVLYPNRALNIEAIPLWRKTSPNWEKWNKNTK